MIFGVTFDATMTFEKHLRSFYRATSQRLGILRKSWQVFYDLSVLERYLRGLNLDRLGVYSSAVCPVALIKLLNAKVGQGKGNW